MLPWPQGIDDGTDDDKTYYPEEAIDEDDQGLKFVYNNREWTDGTWPVHHTYDTDDAGNWLKASYHNIIDDGTDDNEVVDV